MKFTREDQGNLTSTFDITVEKADYQEKYKSELNKIRQKAAIKGFRQGKTPMSIVRKMYGQGILAETINTVLQEQMSKVIEEEKIELVASPLMAEDQISYDFNPKEEEDYTFSFILGHKPEVEIKGADESNSVTDYKIKVDDEIIEKEFEAVRKRLGTEVKAEKDIVVEDRITINAVELNSKGGVKRKGHETGFQVLVNTLDEKYSKEILSKDVGFEFDFDIYELEKDRKEDYVKQYLLNLDKEEEIEVGKNYKGTIKEITRIEPAEVNQEFLDSYLGEGEVTSAEEAKERIRTNISGYYQGQTSVLLHRNVMDKLLEDNPMELPEPFLKKWIKANNENVTEEQMEKEFDSFLTNVRWDIISAKLRADLEVKVEVEDVRAKVKAQVMQYLGGQMPGMDMEPLVDNLMKDEKQVNQAYQEAQSEKLLGAVAAKITLVEEEVSIEKFGEIVKELNEKMQ